MRRKDSMSARILDPASLKTSRSSRTCSLTSGAYLLLGALWFGGSELAWYALGLQSASAAGFSAAKGSLFFVLSAPVLYWCLNAVLQQQSRASELLWAVADGTTDAVFVKNLDGQYLLFNSAAARFVGKPIAEVLGKNDFDIFEPSSAEKAMASDRRVVELGSAITIEERLTAKGVPRTFGVTKRPFRDADGNIAGVIGISRDISDRKRAEAILHEREQLLAHVTEAAQVGLVVVDANYRYLFANKAYTDVLGLSDTDIIGKRVSEIVPHAWDQIQPRLDRALAGERVSYELTVVPQVADGSPRSIRIMYEPRQTEDDQAAVVVVVIDISKQQRAEAEIKSSDERARRGEALLAAVMDSLPVSVFVADANGKLVRANPASQSIWGQFPLSESVSGYSEFVGYWPGTRRRIEAHEWPMARAVQLGETSVGVRVEIERFGDGVARQVELSAAPVIGANGERMGGVVACQDITEKVEALESLRAERDRFEKLVETSPAVICSFQRARDGAMSFPYASRKIEDIYGVPLEDLTSDASRVFAMTHADDLLALSESIDASARNLSVWHAEFRIHHPERGEVWVEGHSLPVRDPNGTITWHGFITDVTKRKQSEVDLKESEWRFRKVFEHAGTGIAITDADGNFQQCNPAYCAVLGRSEQELRSADLATLIHPDDREENMRLLRRLGAGEIRSYEIENRFLHASGEPVLVHKVVTALEGEAGRATYLMAIVTNVTEQRRAERVLRESEERLRVAVEAGDLGVWEYDPATDVSIRSLRHDQMFGYAEAQAAWNNDIVLAHLHPDDRQVFELAIEKGLRTGEFAVQMRARWPDGSVHWLDARGRTEFDATNRPLRMRGVIADVTDRVRAAELLRSVLASVTDAILTIDESGRIETANPATETIFGYQVQELIGTNVRVLMPEPYLSQHADYINNYLRTGQARVIGKVRAVSGLRKDGTTFPADLTVSEFQLDESRRFTGVIRDNSARDRLESQLRQSQKMDAIGRLAGGIAHDFNNLLTVINGYSELLLDEMTVGDDSRNSILAIREAGERAAALTSQLLAFSRKALVSPKVFDLREVLVQAERLLKRLLGEDIATSLSQAAEPCWIMADPNQVHQIIINLAVNARDAMPKGGQLTIGVDTVEVTSEDLDYPADCNAGRYVQLTVTDTGTGIPEEIQTRIFEPFFTTKAEGKGTGLGLATVFGIVQQAGGHISLTSAVGYGTQFRILFPSRNSPDTASLNERPVVVVKGGGELVLLVEDDASVRRITQCSLESHGYLVVSAGNGREALELLKSLPLGVDLLITDVIMPEMNGHELADTIRDSVPELRVLFMTGHTEDIVSPHGIQSETSFFLQKPFTPLELINKVHRTLQPDAA